MMLLLNICIYYIKKPNNMIKNIADTHFPVMFMSKIYCDCIPIINGNCTLLVIDNWVLIVCMVW